MSRPMSNPFFDMDFSKFMDMSKMPDMTKFMDMSKIIPVSDAMKSFQLQGVDPSVFMEAYRKNMEAMVAANQMVCESGQVVMQRQMELVQQAFEAMASMVQAMFAAQSPGEGMAKQADAAKSAMGRCISGMKDLTDTVTRNQYQAMEVVGSRMCEGFDELRQCVAKKSDAA